MTNEAIRMPPKKRRSRLAIAAILALTAIAGAGAAIYFLCVGSSPYAPGASLITADGLDTTNVQAHVNKLAEESMMTTAIPNPIAVDGTKAYAVGGMDEDGKTSFIPIVQNPAENTRDMKVSLVLERNGETEEVLYESNGLIRPGEGFETIELSRDLEKGTYAASAVFEGYDPETHELLGTRVWSVTLIAS